MNILALDIGGANIKAVNSHGHVQSLSVAIRNNPQYLARQLNRLDNQDFNKLAVTMTAELCDCFADKTQGVNCIIEAAKIFALDKELAIWSIDHGSGLFIDPDQANNHIMQVAAANWHVLATYLGQTYPDERILMIDVGSTTTDIIPIDRSRIIAQGYTDTDRLCSGELIYSGIRNTPLMALGPSVYWLGKRYAVMAEPFAMTGDAYVLMGDIHEQPDDLATPDNQPFTAAHAATRIVRMVGGDMQTCNDAQAIELAAMFVGMQEDIISLAIRHVARTCEDKHDIKHFDRIIVSGAGEFLAERAIYEAMSDVEITRLSEELSPEQSLTAPATALLHLAKKHWQL